MKNKIPSLALVVLCVSLSVGIFQRNVFAADSTCQTNPDSELCILNKAVLEDIYLCYKKGGVTNPIDNFDSYKSVFNTKAKLGLPGEYANTKVIFSDLKPISCLDIAQGSYKYSGIQKADFKYGGVSYNIDTTDIGSSETRNNFLAGLGYSPTSTTNSSESCIRFVFDEETSTIAPFVNLKNNRDVSTATLCANVDKNDKISETPRVADESTVADGSPYTFSVKSNNKEIIIKKLGMTCLFNSDVGTVSYADKTWTDVVGQMQAYIKTGTSCTPVSTGGSTTTFTYIFKNAEKDSLADLAVKFEFASAESAGRRAAYSISGETLPYPNLKFSENQSIVLYESYIENVYGMTPIFPEDKYEIENYLSDTENYRALKWKNQDGLHSCTFVKLKKSNKTVYGLAADGHFDGTENGKMQRDDVFNALQKLLGENTCNTGEDETNPDDGTETDPGSNPDNQDGIGTETNNYDTACSKSGGAHSLGWIICPILEGLSEAASSIYENLIEGILTMDTGIF